MPNYVPADDVFNDAANILEVPVIDWDEDGALLLKGHHDNDTALRVFNAYRACVGEDAEDLADVTITHRICVFSEEGGTYVWWAQDPEERVETLGTPVTLVEV